MTSPLTFKDVQVQLSGQDGNVFSILGRCSNAIKAKHGAEAAREWQSAAMGSGDYNDVLNFCMDTLDVS